MCYPVIDTTLPDGWNLIRLSGKPGAAVAARAQEFSPVYNVTTGAPPTLILHGTVDTLTPIAWSERFVTAMKACGNPVELVPFEGKRHAFITRGYGDDTTILQALERVNVFLRSLGWL